MLDFIKTKGFYILLVEALLIMGLLFALLIKNLKFASKDTEPTSSYQVIDSTCSIDGEILIPKTKIGVSSEVACGSTIKHIVPTIALRLIDKSLKTYKIPNDGLSVIPVDSVTSGIITFVMFKVNTIHTKCENSYYVLIKITDNLKTELLDYPVYTCNIQPRLSLENKNLYLTVPDTGSIAHFFVIHTYNLATNTWVIH